jgi:hypothetical protein
MNVFVAFFTLGGSDPIVNVFQGSLHVWRSVAAIAGYCPVCTFEIKCGTRMVECGYVVPLFCRMAHHTSSIEAAALRHAFGKLVAMWVFMTRHAGEIFEVVPRWPLVSNGLVAVNAGYRYVSACQFEIYLLVTGQCHRRLMKSRFVMALLTTVEVRRFGKLSRMRVLMTVKAQRKLHLVDCCLSGWNVALRAQGVGVLFAQRESGLIVLRESILRWLKVVHGMAGLACTLIGPFGKLAIVRIWFMAVGTELECNRFLEVAAVVTGFAVYLGVFALKRILGGRVVELRG